MSYDHDSAIRVRNLFRSFSECRSNAEGRVQSKAPRLPLQVCILSSCRDLVRGISIREAYGGGGQSRP